LDGRIALCLNLLKKLRIREKEILVKMYPSNNELLFNLNFFELVFIVYFFLASSLNFHPSSYIKILTSHVMVPLPKLLTFLAAIPILKKNYKNPKTELLALLSKLQNKSSLWPLGQEVFDMN
jgi:hypothetical protein